MKYLSINVLGLVPECTKPDLHCTLFASLIEQSTFTIFKSKFEFKHHIEKSNFEFIYYEKETQFIAHHLLNSDTATATTDIALKYGAIYILFTY